MKGCLGANGVEGAKFQIIVEQMLISAYFVKKSLHMCRVFQNWGTIDLCSVAM